MYTTRQLASTISAHWPASRIATAISASAGSSGSGHVF